MAPKSSSPGCAALRSGITTISPGHTSSGTRKKRHGERTTAGWIMGRKCRGGAGLALAARPSVDFCGYWQRAANV
jgi:hypothetical protein